MKKYLILSSFLKTGEAFAYTVINDKIYALRGEKNQENSLVESVLNVIKVWDAYGESVFTDGEVEFRKIPKEYDQEKYEVDYEVKMIIDKDSLDVIADNEELKKIYKRYAN